MKYQTQTQARQNRAEFITAKSSVWAEIDAQPATIYVKAAPPGLTALEAKLYNRIMHVFNKYGLDIAKKIIIDAAIDLTSFSADLFDAIKPVANEAIEGEIKRIVQFLGVDAVLSADDTRTAQGEWARNYGGLTEQITGTTQKLVQQVVADYHENRGMTLGDVVEKLKTAFGRARAEAVAITEITAAAAGGVSLYQETLKNRGINTVRVWHTNRDDIVCEQCSPLDGKRMDEWDKFGGGGNPPIHTRCRCFISLELTDV